MTTASNPAFTSPPNGRGLDRQWRLAPIFPQPTPSKTARLGRRSVFNPLHQSQGESALHPGVYQSEQQHSLLPSGSALMTSAPDYQERTLPRVQKEALEQVACQQAERRLPSATQAPAGTPSRTQNPPAGSLPTPRLSCPTSPMLQSQVQSAIPDVPSDRTDHQTRPRQRTNSHQRAGHTHTSSLPDCSSHQLQHSGESSAKEEDEMRTRMHRSHFAAQERQLAPHTPLQGSTDLSDPQLTHLGSATPSRRQQAS